MPQYTITQVQRREEWSSQYGPMVTYAIGLAEHNGWVVYNKKANSPAPAVGESLEGDIIKDNRGNDKFKKAYTPNTGGGSSSYGGSTYSRKEYTPRDDSAIKAQWAIGRAVEFYREEPVFPETKILDAAEILYAMVDKIKKDPMENVSSDGKAELPPVENYDVLPTDDEVSKVNLDEIPF